MPECSNYAARGALIAVIACVYREAIPALPPAGKSRGATEKKGDRILARRGGGGGERDRAFRLSGGGFSSFARGITSESRIFARPGRQRIRMTGQGRRSRRIAVCR